MRYDKALELIEEWTSLGSIPGLDSIRELCHRLGDPQEELSFIHIAGTNGKGSTAAYISTILTTAGLRTGRYTSPAVVEYRERWTIDGRIISKNAMAGYIERLDNVCTEMVAEGCAHPTVFEIETAIAFLYFAEKKCDVVVLETGMGGRLDATNIVTNTIAAVMAHIDYDHMQYLGDSLTQIAEHKAGIIKPGGIVVTGPQDPEVMQVIEDRCRELKVELSCVDRKTIDKSRYRTGLTGSFQRDNSCLAAEVVRRLTATERLTHNDRLVTISEDVIRQGLKLTLWPGRFQTVRKKPLFIVDGAHNVDAALRLRETIDELYQDRRKIYIVGMFRDKDVEKVLDIMIHDGAMVLTVAAPGNPRALESVRLAKLAVSYNPNVTSLDSIEEAVEMSTLLSDENTVTIAFGSLAYLGRIIDIMSR